MVTARTPLYLEQCKKGSAYCEWTGTVFWAKYNRAMRAWKSEESCEWAEKYGSPMTTARQWLCVRIYISSYVKYIRTYAYDVDDDNNKDKSLTAQHQRENSGQLYAMCYGTRKTQFSFLLHFRRVVITFCSLFLFFPFVGGIAWTFEHLYGRKEYNIPICSEFFLYILPSVFLLFLSSRFNVRILSSWRSVCTFSSERRTYLKLSLNKLSNTGNLWYNQSELG